MHFFENAKIHMIEELPHARYAHAADLTPGTHVAVPVDGGWHAIGQIHPESTAIGWSTISFSTNWGDYVFPHETQVVIYDPYADDRRAAEIDKLVAAHNLALGTFFLGLAFHEEHGANLQPLSVRFNAAFIAWQDATGHAIGEIIMRPAQGTGALDEAVTEWQAASLASNWAVGCRDSIDADILAEILDNEKNAGEDLMYEDERAWGYSI